MKKKIADCVVGSWAVVATYWGFFLIRVGLRTPAADPLPFPFEE